MRSLPIPACIVLVLAPAAHAQEVPSPLTLEEALEVARRNSPDYLQVLNDVDVAEMGERSSWGAFLPTVNASVDFSGSHSRSRTGQGDYGQVVDTARVIDVTSSSASQRINFSMQLFDGGRRLNSLRAARANTRAANARVQAREVQLRTEVATAFYRALGAQQTIGVEERLLESAQEQLEMTQRRFEIGAARRDEVLGAQAAVAEQQSALATARNEARKARLELLQAMGLDRLADFTLADSLPPVFDPAALDGEALVALALESSPRVLESMASLTAAERNESAARGARWPSISASAGYGRSLGSNEYGALFAWDLPNQSWGFSLSASIPIFSRFQTSSQIAQAEAQVQDAREQLRSERLALEVEVRSALLDLQNAYRSLELAQQSLALSQERLELMQESYRTGADVSFIDLQSAIDQAARAERTAITAQFSYVTALVTLESKIGKEVRP
ncbi:MAG TPA: TolC family protein [Longimicrobiales bacterium]